MTNEEVRKVAEHLYDEEFAGLVYSGMKSSFIEWYTRRAKQENVGHWISEIVEGEDWKGCKQHYYQPISCSKCHKPSGIKSCYCSHCGCRMKGSE